MAAFKDDVGRSWDLHITYGQHKRVKAATGVDLFTLVSDDFNPLLALLNDKEKFIDVLYTLCGTQHAGMSLEQFADGISGESGEEAVSRFIEALGDFIPSQKAVLLALAKKTQELKVEVESLLVADLNAVTLKKLIPQLQKPVAGSQAPAG